MTFKKPFVLACLVFAACSDSGSGTPPTSYVAARISCTTTADCAARGGACEANECHADNECTSDADCTAGQTCVADPDFGGLCTANGGVTMPLPAWACSAGKDCPLDQGCASDGFCHVDGECHNTWQPDGTLLGDCAGVDQICAASGDPLAGFCTDGRGGPDPYCRSTGAGQCRGACTIDDDCGTGGTCQAGFCHGSDECSTTADCSPNHFCGTPDGWDDYGYSVCIEDPAPACVDDGHGACRLACATDADCLDGGGCGADLMCHASNECQVDADCDPGLICYADAEFGGLCGPTR